MKIFVAAAFEDWRRASSVILELSKLGVECSHDWTKEAAQLATNDNLHVAEYRLLAAREDLNGVYSAEVFLLLTPASKELGCGCWIEMGAALTKGVPVVISGPQRDRAIFCEMAVRFAKDSDAIEYVSRGARPPSVRAPAYDPGASVWDWWR